LLSDLADAPQVIINGGVALTSTAAATSPADDFTLQAKINGFLPASFSPPSATTGLLVNMGQGDNCFEMFGQAFVAGDVSISAAGDGDNCIFIDPNSTSAGPGSPTIFGKLNINLPGNGADLAQIVEAPQGTLNWSSGNGDSELDLGDGGADRVFHVAASFGSGTDTISVDAGLFGAVIGNASGGGLGGRYFHFSGDDTLFTHPNFT
jgi:hypothetical protein